MISSPGAALLIASHHASDGPTVVICPAAPASAKGRLNGILMRSPIVNFCTHMLPSATIRMKQHFSLGRRSSLSVAPRFSRTFYSLLLTGKIAHRSSMTTWQVTTGHGGAECDGGI